MYCEKDVVYRYDGSWPGFLCCVFYSVYQKQLPFAILPYDEPSLTLFHEHFISTELDKAHRVQDSFYKKMGRNAPLLISTAFLSGKPGKELDILRFLLLGYRVGPPAVTMHGHRDVAPVLEMEQNVGHEAHLLTGFLRFRDYGSFLGATIDPKNYVLPLLRPHFCGRYPEEQFVIYDRTHNAALLYQPHKASYTQLSEAPVFPEVSEEESGFQNLWKQFYTSISIKARENHSLRSTHCPKRYWVNMDEMAGQR